MCGSRHRYTVDSLDWTDPSLKTTSIRPANNVKYGRSRSQMELGLRADSNGSGGSPTPSSHSNDRLGRLDKGLRLYKCLKSLTTTRPSSYLNFSHRKGDSSFDEMQSTQLGDTRSQSVDGSSPTDVTLRTKRGRAALKGEAEGFSLCHRSYSSWS